MAPTGRLVLAALAIALCTPAGAQADAPFEAGSFSAGGAHSCAVRADTTLACWGDDSQGQLDGVPAGAFSAVSAGRAHSCAISAQGTLACWGDDSDGQLDAVPSGRFIAVSAGGDGACGIRVDGSLACWGGGPRELADETRAGEFSSISVGGTHACAIRVNGHLACWGAGDAGQVSEASGNWPDWHWYWNGNRTDFLAVAAGGDHSCALRVGAALECWGDDSNGQLDPLPTEALKAISAGRAHTCGLAAAGALECWGDDSQGQLDAVPAGGFAAVSAGGGHTCAAPPEGLLACWGDNSHGQSQPLVVSPDPPEGQVGMPYSHSFETTPQSPGPVFTVATGALPEGLNLSSDGLLSGIPEAAGEQTFTVAASNGVTPAAEQEVTLRILDTAPLPPPPPPVVLAQAVGLPPPVAGESFNLDPVGGVVKAKCPGNDDFARVERPVQVTLRCLVDARDGTVDVTASKGSSGETQTASFWGGLFGLAQEAGDNKKATMSLVGRLECERRKLKQGGRVMLRRRGAGRHLWGSGSGNYKTAGNHGSATVRGTTWLVADRCDGATVFKVREGTVWVEDFFKDRQVVLGAGESYVAKSPIARLK